MERGASRSGRWERGRVVLDQPQRVHLGKCCGWSSTQPRSGPPVKSPRTARLNHRGTEEHREKNSVSLRVSGVFLLVHGPNAPFENRGGYPQLREARSAKWEDEGAFS